MFLTGSGWVPWEQALALLAGSTAAWSDLSGVHIGVAPKEPPQTTHLWAWSATTLYRARIDGPRATVATLAQEPSPGSSPVPVQMGQSGSWAEKHVQVGDGEDLDWEVIDVVTGSAMTFLRCR